LNRTIYHSESWRKVLAETYGYVDFTFQDEATGLLAPCMLIKNHFFRRRFLSSLPFSDESGPIFRNGVHSDLVEFTRRLDQLSNEQQLDYIEIKGVDENLVEQFRESGYQENYKNYTFRLDLSQDANTIKSGFHENIRRNLKKTGKEKIDIKQDDPLSRIDEFYSLHQKTMKRLGTPPHKKDFFTNLIKHLGSKVRFYYAFWGGRLISSIVILEDETKYCSRYVAGVWDQEQKTLNLNTFLFDQAIWEAQRKGFRFFDFGVSRPGSGAWEFKRKWTPAPPQKAYYMVKGRKDGYIDPRQPKIEKLSDIWGKYIPLFLANSIGPTIRGQLAK